MKIRAKEKKREEEEKKEKRGGAWVGRRDEGLSRG